jgi:hypothetical protein
MTHSPEELEEMIQQETESIEPSKYPDSHNNHGDH